MNLNQITIKSTDVKRAVEFYGQLGLKLIVDSSPNYVRFECPDGESTFSISHYEKNHQDCGDLSTILYFEVADLQQTYQHLKALGISFTSKPKNQRWLWHEVSLNDPDGHPLKIFSAGHNRRHPPWRLSENN